MTQPGEFQQPQFSTPERTGRIRDFLERAKELGWRAVERLCFGKPEPPHWAVESAANDYVEYDRPEAVLDELVEILSSGPDDRPPETHKSSMQKIDPERWPTSPQPHITMPRADDLQ